MTAADGRARPDDQQAAIEIAMEPVADLIAEGHQVVLTHGNGPQVGNLLVKNELAAAVVPPVPLDWCGAQTQATIGLLILNALDRALAKRGIPPRTAALVSRTRVDSDDPGFIKPTKPVGRYLASNEASLMIEHGQHWEDRGERGWRRIVASPEPREPLDAPAVLSLLDAGYVVACAGGGGIPVVADGAGGFRGVEAVIDKDLTAALLGEYVKADYLVIATDIDAAILDWGTPEARPLGELSVTELRAHAAAGEFASGSMGPKVEAVCRFVETTSRRAAITTLDRIGDALAGLAGTIVTPISLSAASQGTISNQGEFRARAN
jgi:carbamate kinase